MFNEKTVTENGIINSLTGLSGVKWEHYRGTSIPKKSQDIFVHEWLKDALQRLNPDIDKHPEYADDVINTLCSVVTEAQHTGLVHSNKNFQEWLISEKSRPFGKNGAHITVNLIDFKNIENNRFAVAQQVHYSANTEVYFDIVLYVNGIPLVVGEVKTATRPNVTWQDGAANFMGGKKHYWRNAEPFFVPNLLCFASEGKTFAYGSVHTRFKDWAPWHHTSLRSDVFGLESVLESCKSLLSPQTLLQILKSFTLFSMRRTGKETSKLMKMLPRYPQFEAAKQIVERVRQGDTKKGLIWHFQGSGKSLLMLYAAKILRSDNQLKNPTVLVVVDRRDLDSQINETFGGADVKNLIQVQSCKELGDCIAKDNRGIFITTVFKFKDVKIDESNPNGLNNRDNIIVLVDEAHRTQEGDLGEKMRWALPNAHFYGLTGTPISKWDRNTFHLFGSEKDVGRYMSRYSYKQSIRDGATNPVKFQVRLAELRVDRGAINEEFGKLAKENNLDEENKADLSKRAGTLEVMLKAPHRMSAVSDDIAEHFAEHVKPKKMKGMVVVYDRDACVQMYYLLGKNKNIGYDSIEVVMSVDQSPIKSKAGSKKVNKDWRKWHGNANTPVQQEDFERWQRIDSENAIQKDLVENFKNPNHPLQLIIVTAKLLTGFDAPICYCMYLDKPLRDHTLLQAICRTNRPYEADGVRKDIGLIIDYLGVFEHMSDALAYNSEEIDGVIESIESFQNQFPDQLNKCLSLFPHVDRTLEGFEGLRLAQSVLLTNKKRDEFLRIFGVLSKLWSAINPDPFLIPYRQDYQWLEQIYESVRPVGQSGSLMWTALGRETIGIIQEHTDVKRILGNDLDKFILDEHTLFALTDEEREQRANRLEIDLRGFLRNRNHSQFVDLGERLEKIRQNYESGTMKFLEKCKALQEIAKATRQAEYETNENTVNQADDKEGLTKIFLKTCPELNSQLIDDIVEEIDKTVKEKRFESWQQTNRGSREIGRELMLILLKRGKNTVHDSVYNYIKEHY